MLCFLFVPSFEYKIYCLMLYHLLKSTLHLKANACSIGTFIRSYIQMRVQIKNKAFAYRFYRPFTQQCLVWQSIILLAFLNKLLDQSVPLVTVRSIVSLLTEQLWSWLFQIKLVYFWVKGPKTNTQWVFLAQLKIAY